MASLRIRDACLEDAIGLGETITSATASAFTGRVPSWCFDTFTVEESAANWERFLRSPAYAAAEELLLVAEEDAAGVVGLVLAGKSTRGLFPDSTITDRYPFEITSLQIRPHWQKKGLGRALVGRAADFIAAKGSQTMAVRVLAPNPNRAFYEKLGARQITVQDYDWEGYMTEEVLYGWEDVSRLRGVA